MDISHAHGGAVGQPVAGGEHDHTLLLSQAGSFQRILPPSSQENEMCPSTVQIGYRVIAGLLQLDGDGVLLMETHDERADLLRQSVPGIADA